MAKYARKMTRVPRAIGVPKPPRSTSVIRASRMSARAKLIGAHPLHSDTHHAMTGASFLPKPGKPHITKAPKPPKLSRVTSRQKAKIMRPIGFKVNKKGTRLVKVRKII